MRFYPLTSLLAGLLVLSACQGLDQVQINVQTAAKGTRIEAAQVVARIYGQPAPVSIKGGEAGELLFSGGELDRILARIAARQAALRPHFEAGRIGNTAAGLVARRDESAVADPALEAVLADENNDRRQLYTQTSVAVGHGTDNLNGWLPYAAFTFGAEWIAQAPAGWWCRSEAGNWATTPADCVTSPSRR